MAADAVTIVADALPWCLDVDTLARLELNATRFLVLQSGLILAPTLGPAEREVLLAELRSAIEERARILGLPENDVAELRATWCATIEGAIATVEKQLQRASEH